MTNDTPSTPVEIDRLLADIHARRGAAYAALDRARRGIYRALGNRITGSRQVIAVSEADVQAVRDRVARDRAFAASNSQHVANFDRATAALEQLAEEEAPLTAEFLSRRWSRFFLVPGGHIHSSMSCPTCNRNGKATAFTWLPELSGQSEAEAVASHGAILCTTCYPSAPLSWTDHYAREAERKAAEYCPGSGTSDWKDGKVRTGFYSGNGGYCAHCGGWAGTTSRNTTIIRKHKPAKA